MTAQGFALTERLGRVGAPIKMWAEQLGDLGDRRLADMDAAGIDVQVLSTPAIGVEELDPPESVRMSKELNDVLAKAVADHPDRFAGFAVLPILDAAAAADELDRAVTQLGFKGALINGHTRGRFLDDQAFWPIFERAEDLDVPIYLHPTPPPPQVREAYYSGLPGMVGNVLALAGWGWHCETGLHALRMVLGGVFDRFSRLHVIIGHMGENIPFSLARADDVLTPLPDIWSGASATTSTRTSTSQRVATSPSHPCCARSWSSVPIGSSSLSTTRSVTMSRAARSSTPHRSTRRIARRSRTGTSNDSSECDAAGSARSPATELLQRLHRPHQVRVGVPHAEEVALLETRDRFACEGRR